MIALLLLQKPHDNALTYALLHFLHSSFVRGRKNRSVSFISLGKVQIPFCESSSRIAALMTLPYFPFFEAQKRRDFEGKKQAT